MIILQESLLQITLIIEGLRIQLKGSTVLKKTHKIRPIRTMSASGQCLRQSRRNSSSAWFLKVRMRILIFCVRGVLASKALKKRHLVLTDLDPEPEPKSDINKNNSFQKPNFDHMNLFWVMSLYLEEGTSAMKLSIQYGFTKLESITP